MRTDYVSIVYQKAKEYCSGRQNTSEAVMEKYSRELEVSSVKIIQEEILRRFGEVVTLDDKIFLDCRLGLVECIHDTVLAGSNNLPREYHLIYRFVDMLRGVDANNRHEINAQEDLLLALNLADDLNTIKGPLPGTGLKNRDWDASVAAISLDKQGVAFELSNGYYFMSEEGREQAQKILQDEVEAIGGEIVVHKIIDHEKKDYCPESKRFVHIPESAKSSVIIRRHSLPSNMVLNIALKNLTSNNRGQDKTIEMVCFEKLKKKALLVARAINCQQYSSFECLNIPPHNIARKLLELSLYTSMHQFVQMDPRLAKRILEKISAGFGSATIESLKVEDLCGFAHKLIDASHETSPVIRRYKNFKRLPIFREERSIKELVDIMSIPKGQVNLSYAIPGECSNYLFFPLIESLNNKLLLLPKALTANAAVERVFSLVRETSVSNRFDSIFGKDCLEEILREMHNESHNIYMAQGRVLGVGSRMIR